MTDKRTRLQELLADRALGELSPTLNDELENLLLEFPEEDDGGFDRAVAAVMLSGTPVAESMPSHLMSAVAGKIADMPQEDSMPTAKVIPMQEVKSSRWSWGPIGVLAAAAAIALFALNVDRTPSELDPVQAKTELLASATDVIEVPWEGTADPSGEGAAGNVVWSESEQKGYMTIRGLAVNDPTVEQYQLWIFDATRDDRYPVDGGVFDIPEGADEIVIPIDAKIDVGQPVLFAVTVEEPGGVVVSGRERIVIAGAVSADL